VKTQWYNFKFGGLRVLFPDLKTNSFSWQRITGLQIGDYFFGMIKGRYTPAETTDTGEK